jgi:hypothetical protein
VKGLRIALAIPVALLLAAIAMRVACAHVPPRAQIGLLQPLAVATNFDSFGAELLGALLAAAAAAAGAYWWILAHGARCAGLRGPLAVAGIAALALFAAWCAPVVFSSDVYAYAAYGELARIGANPYAHQALPDGNALFDATIVQWGNPPPACVYGLPFVWVAALLVRFFAPLGVAGQLAGLRVLSSGALLGAALLAYAAYPGDRIRRLSAAATIALNPAAIWCAAEGHNDALVIAVALGGLALARRGRFEIGAAVAAAAGTIKLPGVAACLPMVLAVRRAWPGAALGALTTLAFSAPLLANAATGFAAHARYAPQVSLQALVDTAASLWLGDRPAPALAWGIAAACAAALTGVAIARLRRGSAEGWIYLAIGGWLLVPNPYPWYGIWLLAVAAYAPGTRAAAVAIGLSLTALLRYVPDAVATPGPLVAIGLSIAALVPFAALLRPRAAHLL